MHLHLFTIHAHPSAQSVPLAAASIKAYLDVRFGEESGVTVTCGEVFTGTPVGQLADKLVAVDADMIGFPLYLWNREECCALVHELRRRRPSLLLAAGGPEATADSVAVLEQAPFDFLVVGEGELTVAEIIERYRLGVALDGIPGLARLQDGALSLVPRPPIPDLCILPSPWLAGLLDNHIANGVVWQLSRGCSFGCEFCFDGMGDRRVRRYPLERLEAELEYVVQRGASQIFVLDSTFNQDRIRAKTLLRLIADKAPDVHCHFEVRHELLDREQAQLFSRLTCSLQVGLQSADPQVSRNVGRQFKRQQFVDKIGLLNEAGCIFGFDLIYGLPGETFQTFRSGLDFALSLYPNHLDIFPLSVLPGTALDSKAKALGFSHLKHPPYTLLCSSTFPETDMVEARRLGAACDIFYSRGKAVAWFNAVLSALRLKATEFLSEFEVWLRQQTGKEPLESDYDDQTIWRLQRAFVSWMFQEHHRDRLLPLVLDCVDYHYFYGVTVMAVPPVQMNIQQPMTMMLERSPSTSLAAFTYDIAEILDAGEPDFERLSDLLEPVGSWAVIYPYRGEVCTESLAEPWFRLLERMDGKVTTSRLVTDLGIPADEAEEFLAFAFAEGIICCVERQN